MIKTGLKDGWLPQVEEINADLLILNYPNNPTGRVPSREELKRILEAAEERGIKVLSDEVYTELSFNEHTPVRELYENAITVKSFLKLYSMTGFRLGYAIAQQEDAKKVKRVHRGDRHLRASLCPEGWDKGPRAQGQGQEEGYERVQDESEKGGQDTQWSGVLSPQKGRFMSSCASQGMVSPLRSGFLTGE